MLCTSFLCCLPLAIPTPASPGDSVLPPAANPALIDETWWTSWRGPSGNGSATTGNPPTEWSEERNVRWKTPLPGLGSSSPVILGDRIYVTTAVETEREGAPAAGADRESPPERGRRGGRRGGSPPTKVYAFLVLCLDRKDGEVVWEQAVKEVVPHEAGHSTSSQASNSPITDGEHLFAFFGSRGMHCLDLEGEIVWSKDLGRKETRNGFGEGTSPALHGETLVINWDHEGDSFIVALNKKTGEELWRRPREERSSWTTPRIVEVEGSPQVIVPGTETSIAYDLKNGETIWTCGGMTDNVIPTPVYADGIIFLMSGYRGNSLQAIRLKGAKGALEESDNILWTFGGGTSYTPSALLYDGLLYFVRSNSGVLSCLDAKTGKVHYEEQRLDGMRTVYSSPVGVNGRVYVTSRTGTTKVIAAGAEFRELATNQLDDGFDASPAIVGDELYLRGMKSLYCIAEVNEKD